jgi:prepilin-type processing-associated H-X9-DG protein
MKTSATNSQSWWGQFPMMLPNMEQQPMFNAMNFMVNEQQTSRTTGINWSAQVATLNVLNCPSDTDRLTGATGHSNYAGNTGSDGNSFINNASDPFLGPFGWRAKAVGLRDILDGTSNTAAISERVKGVGTSNNGTFDVTKPSATFSKPTGTLSNGTPQLDQAACLAAPLSLASYTGGDPSGFAWTNGAGGATIYNHVMLPNTWSCGVTNTWDNAIASTASSRHSGIVNVLMSDGSVKAIKSTVNPTTWWAIGTMSSAEVIDANSL